MRHRLKVKGLSRKTTARMSMLVAQVEAIVKHGKIKLTLPRAKQVRRIIEKLITKAKVDTVAARRTIESDLINKEVVKKIMELGKTYLNRPGGYTRIIRLGARKGDAAMMALLELVAEEKKDEKK
ncbi:50S ribosomal protein L17 [candidate division WOR-1 bacterium RIFOXYA12_FULL_43_27]|uniref:50S ribosomal protein L17 n=1 Tax=candidate division WOR-1 bacterium RIFOXYC2_FULL_46_14 TaxID=1802587 RepID=A0A1F4U5V7_UNCSA|nr:MAG: 50S ribosomal protein L17 [candidate division WOR-1 bacterium RIFOXYA12_FULL_43_27]OGC20422.1 MAG: 50S ribosomal protein L17 [candidate division WOR-1 bacterium RIFOXYB2_FULL_46_45]OGC31841.1 MAG: 50S ribosomal protein L17 [candidate division WOR-1 bacterium RIFOXYA2_FULL_46_56]OGC40267.1 MAG: 50S ribosomal protein L17 [candidate division WOR-1 bacterium RIFOXYC2_FULL_46_14]